MWVAVELYDTHSEGEVISMSLDLTCHHLGKWCLHHTSLDLTCHHLGTDPSMRLSPILPPGMPNMTVQFFSVCVDTRGVGVG